MKVEEWDSYVVEVVVKINIAGTKVAAKKSSVRSKNSGNFDTPESQQDQTDSSQPLVEVGYDARCRSQTVGLVFQKCRIVELISPAQRKTSINNQRFDIRLTDIIASKYRNI